MIILFLIKLSLGRATGGLKTKGGTPHCNDLCHHPSEAIRSSKERDEKNWVGLLEKHILLGLSMKIKV